MLALGDGIGAAATIDLEQPAVISHGEDASSPGTHLFNAPVTLVSRGSLTGYAALELIGLPSLRARKGQQANNPLFLLQRADRQLAGLFARSL